MCIMEEKTSTSRERPNLGTWKISRMRKIEREQENEGEGKEKEKN